MTPLSGTAAFLQQAHRNNWQRYLSSLDPRTCSGWDVCVLTASDERQAAMYRRQLAWRRQAGLLPPRTRFLVIADPGGQRIGSGGATLRALSILAVDGMLGGGREARVLIIHSGGDSRRLPHCSATGKLFARVPRVLPDGRASTIFDEFLISLSGLAHEAPPGVLVASGDVLLLFDHLQLSFQRGGVIGVAAAAPVEMGTRHGVYVSQANSPRVRAYLHKPAVDQMERWRAIGEDGTVQIDTGLVWLGARAAGQLVDLASALGIGEDRLPPAPLNLYGDLLAPLAEATELDAYLADTSDGPATSPVQEARRTIWERLRGTPFTVERLQPAVFVHFGTSLEYWRMVTDPTLAEMCGWVRDAAAWLPSESISGQAIAINARLTAGRGTGQGTAVVVDSQIDAELSWHGACLVSDIITEEPLALAPDVVVHQMPVAGGYVTRVYGLKDDPKLAWDGPSATFMNRPWRQWLEEAGVSAEVIWPRGQPRTLWEARLFPVAGDREASLALALPLQDPANAPEGWRERWVSSKRLSLADGIGEADGERILSDQMAIEDEVAARRFLAAVEAEEPADEARRLLGVLPAAIERRCRLAARWLSEAEPFLRIRGYKALAVATGDEGWEERAFRVLAETIAAAVLGDRFSERKTGKGS